MKAQPRDPVEASRGLSVLDLLDQEVLARSDGGQRYVTLKSHYEALGYTMNAAPLIGCYDGFCDNLQAGLDKIDEHAEGIRKFYRLRGFSKAVIEHLHRTLSEPVWCARAPTSPNT